LESLNRPGRFFYILFISTIAVVIWGYPILILILLLLTDAKEVKRSKKIKK